MAAERVLAPLSDTVTVRQTVEYAVRSSLEDATDLEVHLVVALPHEANHLEGESKTDEAETLLAKAENWVSEDAGDNAVTTETSLLGTEEYLFGPRDFAETFERYANDHDIDRVVLDPEYQPGATAQMLQSIERELDAVGLAYDEAPVERPARHERLVGSGSERFDRLFAMFWISYGFYLILGDPTYWFDLVTGAAVAGIVSVSLAHVTFTFPLDRIGSPLRTLRFAVYVPYLIFEIIKANLAISIVILRPSMPIDPTMTRVNTRVRSGLPLLALANSITLTPGTLTVRANDQRLLVHTLIPSARDDLFDGSLERAVRFVFHGREGANIPTPRERGDTEILGGEDG
ncbi:monovalent cation/H+ antiporter subunit E [Natronorubrum daqingense]|uniref:Cation:proton antiporter n=1 Tax=Natronorubrum daqingense TaxID=588898 RepID=A0A1N7FIL3_9EURY|nr:monovalent cation/H+ antiporter subunit E [Natronorubrum daqingense]APX98471.1 cation:proton antiporter [Natronorubrum daqingense]SIS00085.1 multisubunit sodium/proton antiporter, MrpE subunit [Natronorubrum daqingense]